MNDPHLHRSPYGTPGPQAWQRPGGSPPPLWQRPGGSPPPLWQPPVPEDGPKRRNQLGVAALVIASTGLVLACLPVVRPAGWLLLPLGFALGFFALFGTNRKLGAAITALAVSLVGTGLAAVVGLMTVDNSLTSAFKKGLATGFAASSGMGSATAAAPVRLQNPEPTAGPGSREQPLALGESFECAEWEVTIDSVDLDGTATVMSSKYSNDPPDPGTRYAVITVSSTYRGEGSDRATDVRLDFVTDSGIVIGSHDKFVMAPDPRHGEGELYNGGTHTGHDVVQIPQDEGGTLRVTDRDRSQTYFVSTR